MEDCTGSCTRRGTLAVPEAVVSAASRGALEADADAAGVELEADADAAGVELEAVAEVRRSVGRANADGSSGTTVAATSCSPSVSCNVARAAAPGSGSVAVCLFWWPPLLVSWRLRRSLASCTLSDGT